MLAFILRRVVQSILVLVVVVLLAFTMFRFVGDPVNQIVSLDTPAEQVAAVRKSLGLDDPVPVQIALARDPEILFLDEPTLGMDVNAARMLREFVLEWVRERPARTRKASADADGAGQVQPQREHQIGQE